MLRWLRSDPGWHFSPSEMPPAFVIKRVSESLLFTLLPGGRWLLFSDEDSRGSVMLLDLDTDDPPEVFIRGIDECPLSVMDTQHDDRNPTSFTLALQHDDC